MCFCFWYCTCCIRSWGLAIVTQSVRKTIQVQYYLYSAANATKSFGITSGTLAAGCIVIYDWADFPLNQDLQRHLLYQSCYWHLVAKNNITLLLATLSVPWHVRFSVVWGHIFWKYNHLIFRTIFRLVFMLTLEEHFFKLCYDIFSGVIGWV